MTAFGDLIRDQYAEMMADQPRPMPDGWDPALTRGSIDGEDVVIWCHPEGLASFGCRITGDAAIDHRAEVALTQAAWQATELLRLKMARDLS